MVWTSEFGNKSAIFQEIHLRQFPIVLFCLCSVVLHRLMVGCLVGWLFGCLVVWLVGWLVCCRSVASLGSHTFRFFALHKIWLIGYSVCCFCWLVGCLVGWLAVWLPGCLYVYAWLLFLSFGVRLFHFTHVPNIWLVGSFVRSLVCFVAPCCVFPESSYCILPLRLLRFCRG